MSLCYREPEGLSNRRAANNPDFKLKIRHMGLSLSPLVQVNTGYVHPSFPRYLVSFWLLTEQELDNLAAFYHQKSPCRWTNEYPLPVEWPAGLSLEQKRRRFGRFIGLRGCESPVFVPSPELWGEFQREQEDEEILRKTRWYY